jgi:toxin ParE1/3/4
VPHKLFWTSLALKDLLEIRQYIQRGNPKAAKAEAKNIKKSTERLQRFPESGKKSEHIPSVRELVSDHYRFFYRIHFSKVEILRIYHAKRRLSLE